jgi:hypothetical protein
MSGENLSAATKALLRAAKADTPGAAARAKVWSGVTSAVGGAAAGASGAAGAGSAGLGGATAAAGGMSAMKMLVLGTLLGGAVTVGLAATMLQIGPSPRDVPVAATAPVFAAANAATGPTELAGIDPPSANVAPVVIAQAPAPARTAPVTPSVVRAPSRARPPAHPAPAAGHQPHQPPGGDPLAREAALVADARAALAGGDAQGALRIVRSARALPSPQLVPEELAVEGQALRMLGSADEARGVAETLRTSFPESALAR